MKEAREAIQGNPYADVAEGFGHGLGADATAVDKALATPAVMIGAGHANLANEAEASGFPRDLAEEFALLNHPGRGEGPKSLRALASAASRFGGRDPVTESTNTIGKMLFPFVNTGGNVTAATATRIPAIGALVNARMADPHGFRMELKIGRASCRERV